MASSMMTISLSKENGRLKSDLEVLENENSTLKKELSAAKSELDQRDKLITSLECQIRALLTENSSNGARSRNRQQSSTSLSPSSPNDIIIMNGSSADDSTNEGISHPTSSAAKSLPKQGRSKPSQGIVPLQTQLKPPRRSNIDMETPLAPVKDDDENKKLEKEIIITEKIDEEQDEIKEEEEEAQEKAKNDVDPTTKEGEKQVEESKSKKENEEEIYDEDEKKTASPENTTTTEGGKASSPATTTTTTEDQQQKHYSDNNTSNRQLMKARNALKSLPREISISNDDDDEVTKYSIESSPIVEVTGVKMRDAYGARGIYTGTISRSEKFPHGKGTMEYEDGKIYEGEWHRGHWHGKCGSMKTPKGVYTGRVVNDLKEGDGELFFTEGHKFKGRFEQDEPVEGTMTYVDKRQYVGKLRSNVMHGKGVLTYPDGSKYSGDFQNGVQHGKGIYHFSDGSVYEGESVMGVYEGLGKMTWNDGGWYEGEWKQGEANGHGMEIRPDGRLRHHGKWRKGVPVRN